jgi:hypothetical protein
MPTTEASRQRSNVVAVADDPLLEPLCMLADMICEGRWGPR